MARAVICLSVYLSVCLVSASHIPRDMNQSISNLLKQYSISDEDRFDGNPVFPKELLGSKMEDWGKRVFVVGVLEMYDKLIGQMLGELPAPANSGMKNCSESLTRQDQVRHDLCTVLKRVRELRTHHYKNLEPDRNKLLEALKSLKHIQTHEPVVQSKALWELQWLYQEASSLAEKKQRRRRRRQAQRVKTLLRG